MAVFHQFALGLELFQPGAAGGECGVVFIAVLVGKLGQVTLHPGDLLVEVGQLRGVVRMGRRIGHGRDGLSDFWRAQSKEKCGLEPVESR